MLGEVYLIGDLNCRTGQKCDYIVNDFILEDVEDNEINLKVHIRRLSKDNVSIGLVIACLTCVKPLK